MKRLRVSEPLCTRPKALSATFAETRPSLTESSRLVFVLSRSRPKIADSRVHPAARKYSPLQLIGPFVPFFLARYHNGSRKYFDALWNFLRLYRLWKIPWNLVRDATIATTLVRFATDLKLHVRVTGRSMFIAYVHLQLAKVYYVSVNFSTEVYTCRIYAHVRRPSISKVTVSPIAATINAASGFRLDTSTVLRIGAPTRDPTLSVVVVRRRGTCNINHISVRVRDQTGLRNRWADDGDEAVAALGDN